MRSTRGYSCRVVVALLACAQPAVADNAHLDAAHQAMDRLDYETARDELAEAIVSGGNGPAELEAIYLLTGIIDASLNDTDRATHAFETLLVLAPRAQLPAGTAPKIRRWYDAATARLANRRPLSVRAETTAEPPSLTLVVDSDPLAMVAGVRVDVVVDGGGEQTISGAGTSRIHIALPPSKRLVLHPYAVDAHGNRLVELGELRAPITDSAPLATARRGAPVPAHRLRRAAWWLWTGAGGAVAVAAVGTGFAVGARSAIDTLRRMNEHSSQYTFDQAQHELSAARRDAVVANVGFGMAAAAAVAVVTAWLLRNKHGRDAQPIAVTPQPRRDGAAITVGVDF